jgi:hypothetical protein
MARRGIVSNIRLMGIIATPDTLKPASNILRYQ